jgi:hypothetical protein
VQQWKQHLVLHDTIHFTPYGVIFALFKWRLRLLPGKHIAVQIQTKLTAAEQNVNCPKSIVDWSSSSYYVVWIIWDLSLYAYGLDGRYSIPGSSKRLFFLFSTASRPALVPTQTAIQWVPGALSSAVKVPLCESDHSPPSSAEVKSGGAIPPLFVTSSCPSA